MKIDIEEINEIINKEIEFAKQVNPVMALGMEQIRRVLNEYNYELDKKADK
ncbi:hypothetical protein U729_3103 (plasmid) [Clostridium baratii str. Sullivan]|uniref:Uncharacterized protein n=1 Tax=Clostridium baratii str. Sullivan TaxID=1415775 RepID=A0A0A7G0K8_9CLOT|nr:hypothetical protein [Clostridium baratii]AIY85372.1 hypothetical protein U729_3103 [Clostridium baratii str. Sullivan]